MKNLSQKLGREEEKLLLEETTLIDKDLVCLLPEFDTLFLVKDGHFYSIKGKFSEIDSLDPRVSLKYMCKITKLFLKELQPCTLQPYGKLKNSLNQQF